MRLLFNTALVINSLCYCLLISHVIQAQISCRNPNGNWGECVSIYDCDTLLNVIKKGKWDTEELQFLRESQCSLPDTQSAFVCCTSESHYYADDAPIWRDRSPISSTTTALPQPSTITTTMRTIDKSAGNVLPEPPYCGPESLGDKIYSGNDTALDQYPWMALLEYRNDAGKYVLACGGSLLNNRYILTAAHCVRGEIETEVGALAKVRLGEYDINSEIDCLDGDCNHPAVRIDVEEVVQHFLYNLSNPHRHHDIALIRMANEVNYTDFIRPICLPLSDKKPSELKTTEYAVVAGWGRTLFARQSNVKKQLAVPLFDFQECANKFRSRRIQLIASQFCAGGEYAKDSCDGDSGGPLMHKAEQNRWYLDGIVSFGNRCGLANWPGVYTRVRDYIEWIRNNLKP